MRADSPYLYPSLYANQHAGQLPDLELYCSLIPAGAPSILELGCGTGRLSLPLARQGYRVTGVDLDERMLAYATAERGHEPLRVRQRVEFLQGDICSLRLDRRFGAILFPYHSVGHIAPGSQLHGLAGAIYAHLEPGAPAVISVLQPDEELCREQPGPLRHLDTFQDSDGHPIDCYETTFRDAETGRLRFDWYYDFGGREELLHTGHSLYLHSPRDVREAFHREGLRIEAEYGDFDGSPYCPNSPELIQVYRR